MRTYAEYLATMTVKTLHTIAQRMALRGHSRFRKADLITLIDNAIATDWRHEVPVILSTEVAADVPAIVKIMAEVAPVIFSAAPVKAPESAPKAPAEQTPSTGTPEDTDTAELVYAYRQMRATIKNMGNTPGRVKIVGRLRLISAQLKSLGMRPACL